MLITLLSFFGGSTFRMLWGEVSAWLTRQQDHAHELASMKLRAELEAARHTRDLERIKLQADLGVREVQVAGDIEIGKLEADAWLQAVRDVGQKTGIVFLDVWNGSIRPLLATIAIVVIVAEVAQSGFVLSEWHQSIVSGILGIYIADRTLTRRGK